MKTLRFLATSLLIYVFAFMPTKAHALIPPLLQFGGIVNYTIPCVCNVATWGYFTPLYLSSVPVTGPLVYVPYATVPFPNFLITVPLMQNFGAYMPGVQACWQYAGVTCVPIPSIGVMSFVGSSLSPK